MKKKLFAITMCLLMVMCFMPTAAFANGDASNPSNTQPAENTAPDLTQTTVYVNTTNVQDVLDGKYGSINGKTIELTPGDYGVLYLRQSLAVAGDNVTAASTARTDLDYNSIHAYLREISGLTIKAAAGATVTCDGILAQAGQRTSDSNPIINNTFISYLSLTKVTIDGITFDGTGHAIRLDDPNYSGNTKSTILIDELTISNCKGIGPGKTNRQSITENQSNGVRFLSAGGNYSNDKDFPDTAGVESQVPYNNIVIKNCEMEGYFQPIRWSDTKGTIVNGFSVVDCRFVDCVDDHIHINEKELKKCVITGNTLVTPMGKLFAIHNASSSTEVTTEVNGEESNKVINPVAYSWSNWATWKNISHGNGNSWRKNLWKVEGTTGFKVNGETINSTKATRELDLYILPIYVVDITSGETQFGNYKYAVPAENTGTVKTNGRGTDDEGNSIPPILTLSDVGTKANVSLANDSSTATTYTAATANTKFAIAADDTNTKKIDLLSNATDTESTLKFTGAGTYIVNGVTYSGSEDSAYTITYAASGDSLAVTSGTVTVTLPTDKSVKLSGKLGDADVSNLPFTATNSNVSISVSTQNENTRIRVDNGYSTVVGSSENPTGYSVTRYTYSGGTSTTTDNVTNTTETTKTDTGATTTVPETKATVKAESKTAADGTKTTTATVDTTTATKIVEKAVENKSEVVVVSAAATPVAETAAGTTTEVAIPAETISQISEKTEAAVTIESEAAKVTLDQQAVAAVAEQAGAKGTVKLVVETTENNKDLVKVDLVIKTSNGNVSDFKGGNVKVTVKLGAELAAKKVVCVYIDDNGVYHRVSGIQNADGTFTFTTGHFSTYAIMPAEDVNKVMTEQVNTLIKDITLKVSTSKTSKKNIKVKVAGTGDSDSLIKEIESMGYTVKYRFCRSTKKTTKYEGKITKDTNTYINTKGIKGVKYYYRAKVYVYDGETLVAKTKLAQCKYGVRTWSK